MLASRDPAVLHCGSLGQELPRTPPPPSPPWENDAAEVMWLSSSRPTVGSRSGIPGRSLRGGAELTPLFPTAPFLQAGRDPGQTCASCRSGRVGCSSRSQPRRPRPWVPQHGPPWLGAHAAGQGEASRPAGPVGTRGSQQDCCAQQSAVQGCGCAPVLEKAEAALHCRDGCAPQGQAARSPRRATAPLSPRGPTPGCAGIGGTLRAGAPPVLPPPPPPCPRQGLAVSQSSVSRLSLPAAAAPTCWLRSQGLTGQGVRGGLGGSSAPLRLPLGRQGGSFLQLLGPARPCGSFSCSSRRRWDPARPRAAPAPAVGREPHQRWGPFRPTDPACPVPTVSTEPQPRSRYAPVLPSRPRSPVRHRPPPRPRAPGCAVPRPNKHPWPSPVVLLLSVPSATLPRQGWGAEAVPLQKALLKVKIGAVRRPAHSAREGGGTNSP